MARYWSYNPHQVWPWSHLLSTRTPHCQLPVLSAGSGFVWNASPTASSGKSLAVLPYFNLETCFPCHSLSTTSVMTRGSRSAWATGRADFRWCDISLWAERLSIPSVGVFCHCNTAFQTSLLSLRAFLLGSFLILTADYALPLALGCLGEDMMCSNAHSAANYQSCAQANWGLLS